MFSIGMLNGAVKEENEGQGLIISTFEAEMETAQSFACKIQME